MRRARSAVAVLLLGALLLPILALAWGTASRLRPPQPRVLAFADGSRVLAVPLDRDREDLRSGTFRAILSDGSVHEFPAPPSSTSIDEEAWFVRRDDGPVVLGRLVSVAAGGAPRLHGDSARRALRTMPSRMRSDLRRLAREVRRSDPGEPFSMAMRRWELARLADERSTALFEDADGIRRSVRLSSIREARRAGDLRLGGWTDVPARALQLLSEDPDAWTGGGLRPVVSGTLAVVLLSGILGGIPALLAALRLSERIQPGRTARWVRRTSAWFSAVPGVVWGTVGAGVLVGGLGPEVDRWLGSRAWGAGGILWGAATLGALSAPTTLSLALQAVDRVPRAARRIARSCGATRWQVLREVVLPQAAGGLVGAWFSGLARAAGETAPLLMVGAARSLGGASTESVWGGPPLSGGFLHLGVLACDPPWPPLEAELGHPLAFLSLSLLALLCLCLELFAVRLSRPPSGEEAPS